MKVFQPEILAPAGNLSCLKAAIAAGADAVYFGGQAFNARRGAGNFSIEDMKEALRLCRMQGVQTNLTLNTLIKQKEWKDFLRYMDEVLPLGIDAVIVQDLGVAEEVRRHYPQVALHASTQMAVQSLYGAQYLQDLGFQRVVLAREVTLGEIREIRQKTNIQLEVFVHGALCYSYSGRCLLSSFHGGRSGNRGACAQPCRLAYRAEGREGYWMNLKDLCAADQLEALMQAGVDSFKIEGRLKGEAYVAAVTRYYAALRDEYLRTGSVHAVQEEEQRELKQLFNRGGFTQGYYQNKEHMIEPHTPKHQGVQIGKVSAASKGKIQIESRETLHSGDELEIRAGRAPYPSVRLAASMLQGEHKAVFYLKGQIQKGQEVWRIVDPVLQKRVLEEVRELPKVQLAMCFCARIGEAAVLSAAGHTVWGQTVMKAQTKELTEEAVRRQLEKTGDSGYQAAEIVIEMEKGSFLPVSAINELRRSLLQEISQVEPWQKKDGEQERLQIRDKAAQGYWVGLDRPQQWSALCEMEHSCITALMPRMEGFEKADKRAFLRLAAGKRIVPALPPVGRNAHADWMKKEIQEWQSLGVQEFEVNLLGQAELVRALGAKVQAGPHLAVMNREAAGFWQRHAGSMMISQELTGREAAELARLQGTYYMVYGRPVYMISEQCVYREVKGCDKHPQGHEIVLEDRKGERMCVRSHCRLCYSEVLAERPVYISDEKRIGAQARVELTLETTAEVKELWQAILQRRQPALAVQAGHWDKGVE